MTEIVKIHENQNASGLRTRILKLETPRKSLKLYNYFYCNVRINQIKTAVP